MGNASPAGMETATKRCHAFRLLEARARVAPSEPGGTGSMVRTEDGRMCGSKSAAACDTRGTASVSSRGMRPARIQRQQVPCGDVLREQHPVQCFQRELAAAAKKIGHVRLAKTGLARQERDAECPALNSAQQLQAEALVHLREIHVWKIRHEQYPQLLAHFKQQNDLGRFPLILLVCFNLEKITSLNWPLDVDPEDTYPYIGSTYLARFVGKILEPFIREKVERG